MCARPHRFASVKSRKSKSGREAVESLERRQLFAAHIVGDANVYATIQAAVNAAKPNAVINLDAGSYAEIVTINKSLTLRGAQAGIDARSNGRMAAGGAGETIISGVDDATTGSHISSIYVAANDVTIDGLVIQGNTSVGTYGAGIVIAPNLAGTHVFNSIVQNNVTGLILANNSGSDPAIIQHNVFRNNNNAGPLSGRGIYTDGGYSGGNLTNVTIDANYFYANYGGPSTTTVEAAIAFETLAQNAQSNIRITNNVFDANGKATLFFNASNVTLTGNTVTYCKDQWSGAFRFEGGDHDVTIQSNTLYANTGPAIRIDEKAIPASNYNFVVTGNNIFGNGVNTNHEGIFIVGGQYDGTIDLTNNWWGSSSGPGGIGPGTGDIIYVQYSPAPTILYSPWASAMFNGISPVAYLGTPAGTDAKIEVENFDHFGEGRAYHDVESSNLGGASYRKPQGVDLQTTTDAGGGYNLAYAKAGEWINYTVNVANAGTYNLDVRVANTVSGGTFHFEVDGVNVSGAMVIPNTSGYQIFKTITKAGINLSAGLHVVKLVMDVNSSTGSVGNFNWFQLTNATPVLVPNAPSNLAASMLNPTTVALTWLDNANNESGFIIERSPAGANAWQQIATIGANVLSYNDATVAAATAYDYRVYAYNSGGNSGYSNVATITTPAAQTTTYLSDLPWTSATNGYGPVERDMNVGASNASDGTIITLNGVTYAKGLGTNSISDVTYNLNGAYAWFLSDVGVDDHQTVNGSVVFQVFADGVKIFDSGTMTPTSATQSLNLDVSGVKTLQLHVGDAGDGSDYDWGDWAGARLLSSGSTVTVPAAPSGLTASAISPTQVNLAWNDVASETGYRIERSIDGGVTFTPIGTTGVNVTSFSDTSVAASTSYKYRVIATNSAGDSPASNIASVTTPAAATAPAAPSSLIATAMSATRIDLTWLDNSTNESGFKIERSTDGINFAQIGTTATNVASYSDTSGLAGGTKYYYRVRATNSVGDSAYANVANATTLVTVSLPSGWSDGDVGTVGLSGSATYSNSIYTVKGAGSGVGAKRDSLNFSYRQLTGNGTIIARVSGMSSTDPNAMAGIVFRETLDPGARESGVFLSPTGGVSFVSRTKPNQTATVTTSTGSVAPYWLKLVRSGTTITAYKSSDGAAWTLVGSSTVSMTATIYVGLAVTSHNTSSLNTATFDNVSVV